MHRSFSIMQYWMIVFILTLGSCSQAKPEGPAWPGTLSEKVIDMNTSAEQQTESITLGGGCFWCIEAVYQRIHGVIRVVSGYSGGMGGQPTYAEVCTGTTGHAEVVQIVYDPSVIPFSEILRIFFNAHDPTTLNRQGADIGTQYRSVIFYHTENQRQIAEAIIRQLNQENVFGKPVVTELSPIKVFYPAENYHQNYYNLNSRQPYCQMVIRPKIEKIEKFFKDRIKK